MNERATFEMFNYALRPNKHVERKLIFDTLRRLSHWRPLEEYRYVGMGSVWFRDHVLAHQELGMTDLVSFEQYEDRFQRFEFNKPFACIDLLPGHSSKVIPMLYKKGRRKPTICWMDYECKLNDEVSADIQTMLETAVSGDVLVVTVNADPPLKNVLPKNHQKKFDQIKAKLAEAFGPVVPDTLTKDQINAENLPQTFRDILDGFVQAALTRIYGGKLPGRRFSHKQILNYAYRDGQQMLTVGWILYRNNDAERVAQCDFELAPHAVLDSKPRRIHVPPLTIKEVRALNQSLPLAKGRKLAGLKRTPVRGIDSDDLDAYQSYYPFYPIFAEYEPS